MTVLLLGPSFVLLGGPVIILRFARVQHRLCLISAASMLTYTKSLIITASVFSSRLLSRGLANIVRRNSVEEFSGGVLVEKMLFIGAWELMPLVILLF